MKAVVPFALIFASCSSTSTTSPPARVDSASAVVTAADGGQLASRTGVRLLVPPGAVASDTTIKLQVTRQTIDGYTGGFVYSFEPSGLVLAKAALLTLPAEGGEADVVYWSQLNDPNTYEPLATQTSGRVKVAVVRHFSAGFVGQDASASCQGVVCPARASLCADAATLTVVGGGACVGGECVYPTDEVSCACGDGACQADCSTGTALDCDGSALTGCEATTNNDVTNCGACGVSCGDGACVSGVCAGGGSTLSVTAGTPPASATSGGGGGGATTSGTTGVTCTQNCPAGQTCNTQTGACEFTTPGACTYPAATCSTGGACTYATCNTNLPCVQGSCDGAIEETPGFCSFDGSPCTAADPCSATSGACQNRQPGTPGRCSIGTCR